MKGLPWCSVVKAELSLQRAQVWSLVRELRSRPLCSTAKKKKKEEVGENLEPTFKRYETSCYSRFPGSPFKKEVMTIGVGILLSSHMGQQTDTSLTHLVFLGHSQGPAGIREPLKCDMNVKSESCSVVSDSLQPHGLWNSLGQNIGVGSLSLLQEIFLTKGSNPGLLHCQQIVYQLSHQGKWTCKVGAYKIQWTGVSQWASTAL